MSSSKRLTDMVRLMQYYRFTLPNDAAQGPANGVCPRVPLVRLERTTVTMHAARDVVRIEYSVV